MRLLLSSMIGSGVIYASMMSSSTLAFVPLVLTPVVTTTCARSSSIGWRTQPQRPSTPTLLRYQVRTDDDETMVQPQQLRQRRTTTTTTTTTTPIIDAMTTPPTHMEGAPGVVSTTATEQSPPSLGDIRKLLPKSVFQVDTQTSLLYFGLDLVAVVASMTTLHSVVTSHLYQTWPLYAQAMTVLPLQGVTGFAMWCMWCIGHDAGHTTISKHRQYGTLINRVVGELSHSMICLTPFIPWKKSHLQHHLHHNHLEKDYSHQWFVREESHNLHPLIQLSYATRNWQLPILYWVYLVLGVPDGGHVYFYGRLWEKESRAEQRNASVSVLVSVLTAATLWSTMGTADFVVVCMVPWLILSLWLFTVTYLQHHSEDGKLYTDDTWTFTKGAFQTVDRDYGTIINRLSHHMMDGHVIHHLFFTRVPHYHLKEATDALLVGMTATGQEHLYKQIETHNFAYEIVKQFNENWFFCDEAQVVRK